MYKFFSISTMFLLFSCTTQKQEIEYIEFEHKGIILKKSDCIFIRILPSKNKNPKTVELIYKGKSFMRKPISENEYQQIVEVIKNIEEESSHIVGNGVETMVIDGTYNTITYRKGLFTIIHTSKSLSYDWYPIFQKASKSITKAVDLNFSHIP
ncbi:hypothetical protein NAL32_03510 [Chryseobacterium sp. Ch-15]|uniref:Lipoprotein n=1 Tax=Chryseobacterium muglaense TaxID=2893752 RepID=A0A9Q3UWR0_9FLAO|nr:hypothetical protein [Chryseobacterium muglaense]MBD3903140.1 hypothetical protein [Chryseobacterium muglaense]MCC9035972.1 hypothetical protein [Chryseobacterium muglaense]MCM2553452.1 hypothetical protein [Chryseobacterium muglaense]